MTCRHCGSRCQGRTCATCKILEAQGFFDDEPVDLGVPEVDDDDE